ncbi:hypothetical protein SDC9_109952 [bioreactor metagenome]|uniref:Uncharacterized protein n=1 Tax=bioreactor metagenome TaxID=1076179 RepID=A0A645BCL5_9ZZZZ
MLLGIHYHGTQLWHHMPRIKARLTILALPMLRQVDGQHLPTLGTYNFRKGPALLLAAAFAMDKEINPIVRLTIQHRRNGVNCKFFFSHMVILFLFASPSKAWME